MSTSDPSASATASAPELTVAEPEMNLEKVARLRQAIASGSYRVDPHVIAARMIASLRRCRAPPCLQ
jgi:flagellar biosynthesis anti-sigma factor FlgM